MALRIAVLLAAIAQILVPVFVNPFRDGDDAVRAGEASLIEPAGYAFSIWGPIYLLALVYSVWQLLPAGRAHPATRAVAPFATALYLGSSAWLGAAEYGPVWATMPILVAMAACAIVCLFRFTDEGPPTRAAWFAAVLPFGLYAGWVTCASFVNIAEVAPQVGFDRFGLSIEAFAIASIALAALIAILVLWRTRGALAYAAAVVWALTGIILADLERDADMRVIVAAATAVALVVAFTLALKLRGRQVLAHP